MGGFSAFIYGVVVYAMFLGTFLYAVGFVGNIGVPKSIDTPSAASAIEALVVNLGLLALFAVQHSVMARQGFKRMWTRIVPKAVERSTYVLFTNIVLIVLFWQWRAIPGVVWDVQDATARTAIAALFWLGFALVLVTTFLLNHFELFGLRQVVARMMNQEIPPPVFRTPLFYKSVRHPLYLGFILAFWAEPTMTLGHLLFAAGTTGYILVAIWFEERDLVDHFGDLYRRYREDVPMILPIPRRRASDRVAKRGAGAE